MKLPIWLNVMVWGLVGLAVIGLGLEFSDGFRKGEFLGNIADFALPLTLAALVVYVYSTYMLAKDAWTPSASFSLLDAVQMMDNGKEIRVITMWVNHSKVGLKCWCKLNPKVYTDEVEIVGSYGAEFPLHFQPFGKLQGHFFIRKDILAKVGENVDNMMNNATDSNKMEQLSFDIEFRYETFDGERVSNPRQKYYYDFERKGIIFIR